MQLFPRDGMDLSPQAEEAAEAGDRIGHLTADLLDHETRDRPNLLAIRVVNGSALDLIALDQWVSRTG